MANASSTSEEAAADVMVEVEVGLILEFFGFVDLAGWTERGTLHV